MLPRLAVRRTENRRSRREHSRQSGAGCAVATLHESDALPYGGSSRNLIQAYGTCPVCWQGLNRGMERRYSPDAVVAGVTARRAWVACGEPTSPDPAETARRIETEGGRVCWFGVGEQFAADLCSDGSHSAILVGSQPVWRPALWAEMVERHGSLRSQFRHAKNRGVTVHETRSINGLQECLDSWLQRHALPPLRFLAAPTDLQDTDGRRVFAAQLCGAVVGFLVAAPIPAARAWLVEQIARRPDAPSGTSELLIDVAMRSFAADGSHEATLGLSPLSNMGAPGRGFGQGAVGCALRLMRVCGRRLYNFEGVERFKAKLRPDEWRPVFAVVPGRWTLSDLGSVVEAFTGRRPVLVAPSIVILAVAKVLRRRLDKRCN